MLHLLNICWVIIDGCCIAMLRDNKGQVYKEGLSVKSNSQYGNFSETVLYFLMHGIQEVLWTQVTSQSGKSYYTRSNQLFVCLNLVIFLF